MDFTKKSRNRIEVQPEIETLEKLYPHNLLLYRSSPTDDVTLQEFEELALERLKVLRIFEYATSKNLKMLSDEWKQSIIDELNREGLKSYTRLFQSGSSNSKKELVLHARRRDYISHFILRIAYCRSQELKRWFMTREMEVFRMKFASLATAEIKEFLNTYNLKYIPLTDQQKKEVSDGLVESTSGVSAIRVDATEFYKIPFTEVLDLVRNRRCYLKNGFAYVSANDFISVISVIHQNDIETGLAKIQAILPSIESDERLYYLMKSLHTTYTGKDYTVAKGNGVPIECIDQLSKKSFPLCMRVCHETLRTKHHMKHGGRMQYGLFIKGIGVTLEDSLRLWRDEFTKVMDLEKFEKSYAYSIRHNYGKEGSMINYTPYSCMKIITATVAPQDTHGCPFKIFDNITLKNKLNSYGISQADIQEIVNYATKGHYQIACSKYFEVTHNTKNENGIQHPNQYFELSQTVMGNREVKPSTPSNKRLKKVTRNGLDTTLADATEDMELWEIAETQESQSQNQTQLPSPTKAEILSRYCQPGTSKAAAAEMEWEEDFDLSEVIDSDF